VDFAREAPQRETEVCAPCHARRSELTAAPVVGAPLYDDYLPALLGERLYHPDGQQQDEVYVYGSWLQSKMHRAGVRCSDCHDSHSAKLRTQGNGLCVRCHGLAPDVERFPGLVAKNYDSPAHHFHADGSPGSACVECHMPENAYMIVDPRRDHSIRVPRPDLSVKLGTPNPCAKCHADRTPQWAAEAVESWYPASKRPPHYGENLAAGRKGTAGAEQALASLVADATQPPIVRASALELLTGYGPASVPASIAATRDPDPAVRTMAAASLERAEPAERLRAVAPLLADPLRAVRIEAARVLSSVPRASFDEAQRAAYQAARDEFVAVQNASLEAPGSHLNLGVLSANEGDTKGAEEHYRRALVLDPDFSPARLNLAQMLDGLGRTADAVVVLQQGIARIPDQGELHYSLGLALAQEKRFADAATALGRAADLLPARARVRYNLALVLQHIGKPKEAEDALAAAQKLDPSDPEIVYALTLLYAQQSDWARAITSGEKLAEMMPGNAGVEKLLADLRSRAQPGAAPASP
jgi:predicted CXXCH cytochrome family protein